jgi:hypothetical protein
VLELSHSLSHRHHRPSLLALSRASLVRLVRPPRAAWMRCAASHHHHSSSAPFACCRVHRASKKALHALLASRACGGSLRSLRSAADTTPAIPNSPTVSRETVRGLISTPVARDERRRQATSERVTHSHARARGPQQTLGQRLVAVGAVRRPVAVISPFSGKKSRRRDAAAARRRPRVARRPARCAPTPVLPTRT